MFPFANNGSDPIPYGDQLCYERPFFNDITNDLKHEESLLSFFHLPSPYIPFELELEDVFLQQSYDPFLHQQPLRAISTGASQSAVNMVNSNKNDIMEFTKICHKKSHNCTTEPIPRKRSSKRDRHSKINTAQGPRDRRMRLSLKVAREFFDLQDKLGFDKASKTVEWLLIQSRHEIKKLRDSLPKMNYSYSVGAAKSASSASECEVVSGIEETSIEGRTLEGAIAKPSTCAKKEPSACAKKERKPRPSRKTAFHHQAKESREKARARARERTREKLWSRRINATKRGEEAATHEMNHIGRCSSFEKGEESGSQSHDINPPMVVPAEIEPPNFFEHDKLGSAEDMIGETLVSIGNWSPSTYISHLHNPGIPQQECQSSDLPILLHIIGGSYNIQSQG